MNSFTSHDGALVVRRPRIFDMDDTAVATALHETYLLCLYRTHYISVQNPYSWYDVTSNNLLNIALILIEDEYH